MMLNVPYHSIDNKPTFFTNHILSLGDRGFFGTENLIFTFHHQKPWPGLSHQMWSAVFTAHSVNRILFIFSNNSTVICFFNYSQATPFNYNINHQSGLSHQLRSAAFTTRIVRRILLKSLSNSTVICLFENLSSILLN